MSPNDVDQKIMMAFFKVSRRISMIGRTCDEEWDLTILQTRILYHISHSNGLKMSDLAKQFMVKPASMTQQITVLKKKGLVERYNDINDRRVVKVRLSKEANKMIKRFFKDKMNTFKSIISSLSEKEKKNLITIAEKMANAAQEKLNNMKQK
ncbi:MarR family transcriptional regulator [Candidatus Dojkabacteria bacterium]|nr:MarR family transcriptional regulator [Candidatus Dojkabacteria bacterium]